MSADPTSLVELKKLISALDPQIRGVFREYDDQAKADLTKLIAEAKAEGAAVFGHTISEDLRALPSELEHDYMRHIALGNAILKGGPAVASPVDPADQTAKEAAKAVDGAQVVQTPGTAAVATADPSTTSATTTEVTTTTESTEPTATVASN